MTITVMVMVALLVLFGAALMGKMLLDMFPGSLFGTSSHDDNDERTPAE